MKQTAFRVIIALAAFVGGPVIANPAMPLPSDATAQEILAYDALDKHCARCHQDGALKTGMTTPKSGFGHVLDIRRLAHDAKFVVQGDAVGSKLHNVIGQYSFPAMPDDCTEDSCFPTQAESDAIADWIVGLANIAPPPRPYIPLSDLYAMAHADLQSQPNNRHDRIRYFSLREVHNNNNVSDENYAGYRAATIKLLNALSWNPTPYKPELIDPNGVLIRVFMPDLEWDHSTWNRIEIAYPYGMIGETDLNLSQLQYLTGSKTPILRADWFASTASVSPLYYDILRLPDTVAGLEAKLNIDMNRNIRNEQVVRAGFQNSGVSGHNRLIERHALGSGFFWTSYDFAGSAQRQSFFEFPLGPASAYGDELAFHHDGGESIFTLPNGFHAYYLNTADGVRLDVGPTSIVRDDDYTDGTGEVVNGISCMSCHSKGIRLNEDKVRDVALADMSLSPAQRQTIDAIYPGQEVVAQWMQFDTDQFFGALESVGIEPATTAGGLEPIRGLFVYHVDFYIDFAQAANELGITEDMLRARLPFVGPELASLIARLDQSPIARDEWAAAYPVLLERLTDYKPIYQQGYDYNANLSYSVSVAIDDYLPKPPVNVVYKPGDPNYVAPPVTPTYKPGHPNYVAPETPTYKPGDPNYVPPVDTTYKPGDPNYVAPETPTYKPGDPNYKPVVTADPNYKPVAPDYTVKPAPGYVQPAYVPSDHSVATRSLLTVYTDQPSYKVGEGLIVYVEPRHDCRLTLINIDEYGKSCVLYPHPGLPDEVIKGGTQFVFPPRGSLRTTKPGLETLLAVCNASSDAVAIERRDTSHVSCDVSTRANPNADVTYKNVVNEVFALDLGGPEKVADSGATYKAISTHNPDVAKAQISVPVTEY